MFDSLGGDTRLLLLLLLLGLLGRLTCLLGWNLRVWCRLRLYRDVWSLSICLLGRDMILS